VYLSHPSSDLREAASVQPEIIGHLMLNARHMEAVMAGIFAPIKDFPATAVYEDRYGVLGDSLADRFTQ